MKLKFNFLHYFLVLSFAVSIGMLLKDLFYFILFYNSLGSSLDYFSVVIAGAILYKFDLLISVVCAGFLLIEKYLNSKELKGGIENGSKK